MRLLLKSTLFCTGILSWSFAHAQHEDSLKSRLSVLLNRYQHHFMQETDYLKAVDSVVPLLEKEDSLHELLYTYRQLAFSDESRGQYRAGYYTYLAVNAYNLNRPGSAVYYFE